MVATSAAWILSIMFYANDYKASLPTNMVIEYSSSDKCEKAKKLHQEALEALLSKQYIRRTLICSEK